MKNDARYIAFEILEKVNNQRATLDEILEDYSKILIEMPKRDRSLMNAIVFGVLRWQAKLDYIIQQFSKRKISTIDSSIKNILRIGIYQIIYLSRIPDAAAVHSAVEIAKMSGFPWASGYVNAVLRRTSREYKQIVFPDKAMNPIGNFSTEKSMPMWLVKRWMARYGLKETEALCDRMNSIPVITIRMNSLKADVNMLEESLKKDVSKLGRTEYSSYGVYFSSPQKTIPEMESFKDGWFQVQDEAAQLVTLFFGPQSGERILDSCSGRGGKTGFIGQLMENKGSIVAMDRDSNKLDRLVVEMNRLGVQHVETVVADISDRLDKKQFGEFDRILLDAPCTGLGVLQRNPDAKWRIIKQNFSYYRKNQLKLLGDIAMLIKPSGILVYTVCSMEPEENEDVIKEFLNNHDDFAIDKNSGQLHGKATSLIDGDGFFRSRPHIHHMDGFFAVRLRRIK